jgi:hypothetical protein
MQATATHGIGNGPVAATYDDAGSIAFRVELAGVPSAATDAQVTAMVGTTQPGGCMPAAAIGGLVLAGPGIWVTPAGDRGVGTHARDGAIVTFAASAPQLALGPRDCAILTLVDACLAAGRGAACREAGCRAAPPSPPAARRTAASDTR